MSTFDAENAGRSNDAFENMRKLGAAVTQQQSINPKILDTYVSFALNCQHLPSTSVQITQDINDWLDRQTRNHRLATIYTLHALCKVGILRDVANEIFPRVIKQTIKLGDDVELYNARCFVNKHDGFTQLADSALQSDDFYFCAHEISLGPSHQDEKMWAEFTFRRPTNQIGVISSRSPTGRKYEGVWLYSMPASEFVGMLELAQLADDNLKWAKSSVHLAQVVLNRTLLLDSPTVPDFVRKMVSESGFAERVNRLASMSRPA